MASPNTLRRLRLQHLDKGAPQTTEGLVEARPTSLPPVTQLSPSPRAPAVQASPSYPSSTTATPSSSSNFNTIFNTPSSVPHPRAHTEPPNDDNNSLQLYVKLPSREISKEQLRAFILCQFGITVDDIFINTKEQKYQTGGVNQGNFGFVTCTCEADAIKLLADMHDADIGNFEQPLIVRRKSNQVKDRREREVRVRC